jgi:hypothetical protein
MHFQMLPPAKSPGQNCQRRAREGALGCGISRNVETVSHNISKSVSSPLPQSLKNERILKKETSRLVKSLKPRPKKEEKTRERSEKT